MRTVTCILAAFLLLGTARSPAGENSEKQFQFAWLLMTERQEYDTAARKFAEFVRRNPRHAKAAQALSYMGICYNNLKKFGAAAQSYERLLAEYPQADVKLRREAMLNGGHANLRLGRYQRAAGLYSRLLKEFPMDRSARSARFWRGECYSQLARKAGKQEAAAALLTRAVADFDAYIKRYPESKQFPAALGNAGFACYDKGDFAAAIRYLTRVIKEFPQDKRIEDYWLTLAQSYDQSRQYVQARAAYARMLRLFPGGRYAFDAQNGIAWCDHAAGKILEAARGFAKSAKMAGKDRDRALDAHYNAGAAFREAGKFEDAIRELAVVGAAEGHRLQGPALFRMGAFRLEQARDLDAKCRQALEKNDRDTAARLRAKRKAMIREAAGFLRKAVTTGTLGPDAPEAGTFLGEALLDLQDYPAAAKAFGHVAETWPKDERAGWALYHMALALREQARGLERAHKPEQARRKVAEAKEALKKVFVFHPRSRLRLQAAYAMADYQAELGLTDKSRAAYKWIAESGPAWAAAWRDADGKPDPELIRKVREFAVDSLFRLGESYYPDADPKRAAEYYRMIIQRYPRSPQAAMSMLRLGELAEARNDYDAAMAQYAAILKRGKKCAAYKNALFDLGVLQLVRSRKRSAGDLLSRSLANLGRFIQDYPDDILLPKAHYYRAEALYAMGRKAESRRDYRKSLELDAKGEFADKALFGLAWCEHDLAAAAANSGRKPEAAATASADNFAKLVRDFPKSSLRPDALYMLCTDRYEHKDYAGAIKHAKTLTAEYPKTDSATRALIVRAKALDDLGRHQDAIDAFNAFLKKHAGHPDTPRVLYGLSWAWWGLARPEFAAARKAEKVFRKAVSAKSPQVAELKRKWQARLAVARKYEDSMAAALECLAKSHTAFALIDEVFLRLGEVAYDRKQYERALGFYRNALKSADSKKQGTVADKALYRIGWCLLRQAEDARFKADNAKDTAGHQAFLDKAAGLEVESLKTFERLARDYPKSPFGAEGYFRAAELRRRAGDHKGAMVEYRRAMARAPKARFTPAAAYGIGVCHLEMKEHREALKDFTTLLEAFPKTRFKDDANWGAGQACFELKAYKDAEAYFNKVLAGDEECEAAAKARFGLGMILLENRRWEKAREEFLKVHAFHSAWPQWAALALYKAGIAARKMNKPEKAKKDMQVILKRYPFTAVAEKVKKQTAVEE